MISGSRARGEEARHRLADRGAAGLRRLRDDDGSILPLVFGYVALSLVLVLLVAATTSLYLERKRLFTLADGAALAGAEAFPLGDVQPGTPRLRLRSAAVTAAVHEYLDSVPTAEFDGLRVERAGTVDGTSATVVLSSYWRPPVLTLFVPEGIRIEVEAVGRSVFG